MYDAPGLALGDVSLAPLVAHARGTNDKYDVVLGIDNLAPYVIDLEIDKRWLCLGEQPADEALMIPMMRARVDGKPTDTSSRPESSACRGSRIIGSFLISDADACESIRSAL